MTIDPPRHGPPGPERSGYGASHWLGFLVSGGTAFVVDAVVLGVLVHGAGMHPLAARIAAIASAMVVGWLCHRRLTFTVGAAPTAREFARYAGSAAVAAILNYTVYAAALMQWPAVTPFGALVLGCMIATIYTYLAMRYVVFRMKYTEPDHFKLKPIYLLRRSQSEPS